MEQINGEWFPTEEIKKAALSQYGCTCDSCCTAIPVERKDKTMYSTEAEQRERDQQAIIDERETFIFTEDQLVSMLQGAIEIYTQYRIASSEDPSKDMAIFGTLQGLTAERQLADLGVIEASLQIYKRPARAKG